MSDEENPKHPDSDQERSGVSRRDFLKISGIAAAVPVVAGPQTVLAADKKLPVYGPGKVPMVFNINNKKFSAELEPRVTLLDALRDEFELTGSKRVCDRGECGACTVLVDGKLVYSCSTLAIEAQRAPITTIESIMAEDKLHPIQQAFVENDASQCGFCTPGFVVASKAMLDKIPAPTADQIRQHMSGNLCRCGTYEGIRKAIAQVAQKGA